MEGIIIMEKLKGKKLLLLEGNILAKTIIDKAHEMGVFVIIANWYSEKDAPAKAYADKAYTVNIFDIPAMMDIIKKEKIDGIFTAFTDSHLHIYNELCETAKLPCFTAKGLVDIMVDKAEFKFYCKKAGLPIIDEYNIEDDWDEIDYPVIVKPVDNSGARGISICHDASTLEKAVNRAKKFSKNEKFIIEKYLRGEYCLADFIIQYGKAYFCASSDKPANDDDKDNVNLPGAYIFPSRNNEQIKNTLSESVQKFVDLIGYKNGLLCFELINSDNKIYVIEAQFRLGAKYQDVFLKRESCVDQLEMLITHSITGKMDNYNLENEIPVAFKNNYVLMNILLGKGTIKKIQSFDEVSDFPNVDEYIPMKKEGDIIEPDGSMVQRFGKVALSAPDRGELIKSMKYFQDNLKILDENMENMVIKSLSEDYS